MNAEGRLRILLHWEAGQVRQVAIDSSRPLQLPRLFQGQTPEALLETLPRLYALCGNAQAAAAHLACRQALCHPPRVAQEQRQAVLVVAETVREHLMRVVVDWAGWVGERPDPGLLAEPARVLPALRLALFGDAPPYSLDTEADGDLHAIGDMTRVLSRQLERGLFAVPCRDWLRIADLTGWQHWLNSADTLATRLLRRMQREEMAALGRCRIPVLPPLSGAWLEQRLGGEAAAADAFVARPHWRGSPCETGPLQRQQGHPLLQALMARYGNGLLPRLVARLLELAESARALSERAVPAIGRAGRATPSRPGGGWPGRGIGQLEAARGRLVHRLRLHAGQVKEYRVLAPTEWNFHPDGVLARGLRGLCAPTEAQLRKRVALLVHAIDPCVGYELELLHA